MIISRNSYINNPLSIVGIMVALVAGLFHLTLLFMDVSRGFHNPYLNIWLHLLLPPIVVVGFFLALFGAWRQRRRAKRRLLAGLPPEKLKSIRQVYIGTGVVIVLLVPFIGVTSYEGYKYTDSIDFCGKTCHEPMNPAYTAYQYSPHARVPCSDCHIGEGASWFVRSKLSGTRQVLATVLDTFHRPIKTPLENLRPARETCERCHWPDKAFGDRVVELPHFASDEKNTPRLLTMVLHTMGGDPEVKPLAGIHWHVSKTHEIEFVATDEMRLVIPWVRMTTADVVKVFRSDGLPADAPPPEGEFRKMDCIDCHNRPSHRYKSPDEILNSLFSLGLLDTSLPYLKREAARIMVSPFDDTESARKAITGGLKGFYRKNYPEIARGREDDLDGAVKNIIKAFERNIFPEMRTDWRAHPDHIGHMYSPGCFRCHDDLHKASDGSLISKACSTCHDFLTREKITKGDALVRDRYRHPFPLEKDHARLMCYQCHDGGPTPPRECDGCHHEIRDFIAGTLPILKGVTGEPDPMNGEVECSDCHDGPKGFEPDEIVPLCVYCHDEEYRPDAEKYIGGILEERGKAWEACRSTAAGSGEGGAGKERLDALDLLDRLRPIHNAGYAIKIYRRVEKDGRGSHKP